MAEPNAANVFAGPTVLYMAAEATAFPSLAALPTATNWATAGFTAIGYTEDGVEFVTTPSIKEIIPDETINPVLQLVTNIKLEVKVKLLERHIENLTKATSLAVLSNPGTGIKTLSIGSGNSLVTWAIGFQGPAPGGATDRVITVWRAQVVSGVSQKYTRKDVPTFDVTFSALTDSTKATTRDVYEVVDFGAGS